MDRKGSKATGQQPLLSENTSTSREKKKVSPLAAPLLPSPTQAAASAPSGSDAQPVTNLSPSSTSHEIESMNKEKKGPQKLEETAAASGRPGDKPSGSPLTKQKEPAASLKVKPYAVTAGKRVSETLKENVAKTMASAFADHLKTMTNRKYIETRRPGRNSSAVVDESSDGDTGEEEEESSRKSTTNDIVDRIIDGKSTYIGGGVSKRKHGEKQPVRPQRSCPAEVAKWLSSAQDAFTQFANFILTMAVSSEGKRTLESLYREDIRTAVEAVMCRQKLFDNASPAAKGLARFDMHVNLLPSDMSAVLDSSMAAETDTDPLNALSMFKDETKELLCHRVTDLLKHLSPNVAASVFNDAVKYVRASFSFYMLWGDLPGTEFKALLADVNIRIMERALSVDSDRASNVFGDKEMSSLTSSSLASLNLSEEDSRTMINALQKIRDWKPISKDYPSRIDKARDVVLIPETGKISKIPVTPTDLLHLVSYINALLSLEQRSVFTNGFFNAACVLISQCLAAKSHPTSSTGSFMRPSRLAAKVARDNLLSLHVIKNSVDGSSEIKNTKGKQKRKEDTEETIAVEGYSSSELSSNSSTSDSDHKGEKRRKRAKKKQKGAGKKKKHGDEGQAVLRELIYRTGGFFYDTSEFGNKVRHLINSKDYRGLVNYASTLVESGSNMAMQRLVASLLDIVLRKTEQYEDLKRMCSCPSKTETVKQHQGNRGVGATSASDIAKMMIDPQADRNEMARYFLSTADPAIVSKHEAFVLTERLLPSDKNMELGTLIKFFFKGEKATQEMELDEGMTDNEQSVYVCHAVSNPPNLLKLANELFGEMSKKVLSVLNMASESSPHSNEAKNKLDVDAFLQLFSPIGSTLKLTDRIKLAINIASDGDVPEILFSPVKDFADTTISGLKLTKLINSVIGSLEVRNIHQNSLDLSDPNDTALSIMLFPPSSADGNDGHDKDEEISVLSKLAKGLFSIAEGCTAVVRSREFDEVGSTDTGGTYALILSTHTMDKAVHYAASALEEATAQALYADDDMRPSRVLEGTPFVEGALSYILNGRENVTEPVCTKPSSFAKFAMSEITGRYLGQLKSKQQSSSNKDPTVAREEAASDRALVEVVMNRPTGIVKAQIANAMGLATLTSAAVKVLEADAHEAEARLLSNQATPQHDSPGTRATVTNKTSIMKNLAHLCLTVAVAAAANMTKLSNQHFFDMVKEANMSVTKRSNLMRDDVKAYIKDKGMTETMLLGYSNNLEHSYFRKQLLPGQGPHLAGGGRESSTGNVTGDWLSGAIDTITGNKKEGILKDNVPDNRRKDISHSSVLLGEDADAGGSSYNNSRTNSNVRRETKESIMNKLREMI